MKVLGELIHDRHDGDLDRLEEEEVQHQHCHNSDIKYNGRFVDVFTASDISRPLLASGDDDSAGQETSLASLTLTSCESPYKNNDVECFVDEHVAGREGDRVDIGSNCDSRSVTDTDVRTRTHLLAIFIMFIVSGSGNAVFQKLQAVPMYNYPNFLNLFLCLLYIPICFAYIIPAVHLGMIPQEQLQLSKKPFAIMGALDCLAGIMQVFASVHLPGPLLILLPQVAIPISMVFSKRLLQTTYLVCEYVGAIVVIVGIVVVLLPVMTNVHGADHVCVAIDIMRDCAICRKEATQISCLSHVAYNESLTVMHPWDDLLVHVPILIQEVGEPLCFWQQSTHENSGALTMLIWSAIMMLSCVPMALSSIYKELTMGSTEIDTIFLNGWVAIFQTFYSSILSIPAGLASSPMIYPKELPMNLWNGFKCYFGYNTLSTGCHPDICALSPVFVNTFLVVNFAYSNFMILLLKYGSANIMFLALTVIVPVGNLAFSLPVMPEPATLRVTDLTGLCVITIGIVAYRFGSKTCAVSWPSRGLENDVPEKTSDIDATMAEPLLQDRED